MFGVAYCVAVRIRKLRLMMNPFPLIIYVFSKIGLGYKYIYI